MGNGGDGSGYVFLLTEERAFTLFLLFIFLSGVFVVLHRAADRAWPRWPKFVEVAWFLVSFAGLLYSVFIYSYNEMRSERAKIETELLMVSGNPHIIFSRYEEYCHTPSPSQLPYCARTNAISAYIRTSLDVTECVRGDGLKFLPAELAHLDASTSAPFGRMNAQSSNDGKAEPEAQAAMVEDFREGIAYYDGILAKARDIKDMLGSYPVGSRTVLIWELVMTCFISLRASRSLYEFLRQA